MRNPKKRSIISPRKTAFLLIFSMLLSVFTVFPSFAEGSGETIAPPIPDTVTSDEITTEPSVNIETEPMQTAAAATVSAGAKTVMGFENPVEASACNLWCEAFFEFYVTARSDITKNYIWVCSQTDTEASKHPHYEYTDSEGDLVSLRNYVIAGNQDLPRN